MQGRWEVVLVEEITSASALRHEGTWHTGHVARDQVQWKHRLQGRQGGERRGSPQRGSVGPDPEDSGGSRFDFCYTAIYPSFS